MKFSHLLRKNTFFNLKKNNMNSLNKTNKHISFLNSEDSKLVDEILMSQEVNFSIDQLMEIAGFTVATAINKEIENQNGDWKDIRRILNISGPGSKNTLTIRQWW